MRILTVPPRGFASVKIFCASFMTIRASPVVLSASGTTSRKRFLDFLFRTDGFGCNKPATLLINHGNPASKYELRKAVQMRSDSRKENDRQIKEVRIADARWLNLDTGEVIEHSHAEQALLSELEALRRQVELLTE